MINYKIHADISSWPIAGRGGNTLPYSDLMDCSGSVEINFSYNQIHKKYENDFLNIPLFLAEISDFLERISTGGLQRWYLGFAPFAYGKLIDSNLLISSRSGNSFDDGIFDITHAQDLDKISKKISTDILRYGQVEFSEG